MRNSLVATIVLMSQVGCWHAPSATAPNLTSSSSRSSNVEQRDESIARTIKSARRIRVHVIYDDGQEFEFELNSGDRDKLHAWAADAVPYVQSEKTISFGRIEIHAADEPIYWHLLPLADDEIAICQEPSRNWRGLKGSQLRMLLREHARKDGE